MLKQLGPDRLSQKWVHLRSNPPHRQLNPEHRITDYEGIELKQLLHGMDLSKARWIYAVGADDYVSMIPSELIQEHRSILAFRENGKGLTKQRGGQQVVFATEPGDRPVAEPYAKKAAFWAWYVRAIVVDSLPNSVLSDGKPESLKKEAEKATPLSLAPLGTFSYEKYQCPEAYGIPVNAQFLGMVLRSAKFAVRFLSLSGRTVELSPDDLVKSRYLLAVARGEQAIPVQCGGPFLLIKRDLATSTGNKGGSNPEARDDVPLIYGIEGIGS